MTEIRDTVSQVVQRLGAVDILVYCVGIQREQPLLDVSEEAFDEVYSVNLKAAMFRSAASLTRGTW